MWSACALGMTTQVQRYDSITPIFRIAFVFLSAMNSLCAWADNVYTATAVQEVQLDGTWRGWRWACVMGRTP